MTTINLTSGDDNHTAGTAGDVINGLAGNDTLQASSGGNELRGGDGNDVLYGGAGDDTLYGDDSTNFTYHNTLQGGGGNDVIVSYSWYDQVLGGAGDDAVISTAMTTGQGLDGGTGERYHQHPVAERARPTRSTSISAPSSRLLSTVSTAPAIPISKCSNSPAGQVAQTIAGGAGDDTIFNSPSQRSSFDAGTLAGRGGNDLIAFYGLVNPGTGMEQVYGGAGTDLLTWSIGTGKATTVAIDVKAGTVAADGTTFASFSGFEQRGFYIFDDSGVQTLTLNGDKGVDQFTQGIAGSPTNACHAGLDQHLRRGRLDPPRPGQRNGQSRWRQRPDLDLVWQHRSPAPFGRGRK